MIISRKFEEMTLEEVRKMASGEWREVDRHWDDHIIVIETDIPEDERVEA